jgi:excisionase family DNA binding protein
MGKTGKKVKQEKPYMTTGEVAGVLNMPRKTVSQLAKDGRLASFILPGMTQYRFKRNVVMEYKESLDATNNELNTTFPEPTTNNLSDISIKHDVEVFRESDEILDEDAIKDLTGKLENELQYRESQQASVLKYLSFFSYVDGTLKESNKYLTNQVQIKLEALVIALRDFMSYSSHYFQCKGITGDDLLILWPYESDVPTAEEVKTIRSLTSLEESKEFYVSRFLAEQHPRIDEHRNALIRLVNIIVTTYSNYRVTVRKILFT